VPADRLEDMQKNLVGLSLDERKKVKGLEPGRADLIIPGIQFTIMVMDFFGFEELIVSDYGLLEGVLFDIEKEMHGENISETRKP
jgi:exopolyphosphatase/guanosine-5'-triphosphate,3'-diphosphate pyrophosphatase